MTDLKLTSKKSVLTDDIATADAERDGPSEVQTLSLGAFVTALKAANEKVRTLTATRTDERMAKAVGALKASRKARDEAYRQLVKFVNAYALIEGDSKYLSFIECEYRDCSLQTRSYRSEVRLCSDKWYYWQNDWWRIYRRLNWRYH